MSQGPTFPSIIAKTSQWHMLSHTTVPLTQPIEARLHRIVVPHVYGDQHNPSVHGEGRDMRVAVRVTEGLKTTNYISYVSSTDWKLHGSRPIRCHVSTQSLEDLRLFTWRERLWALGVSHHNSQAIRQALFELSDDGTDILKVHVQPSDRQEKNWMPCVQQEDDLRLIYSTDPLIALKVMHHLEGYFAHPDLSKMPQTTGHVRGGSQLIPWGKDEWLAVVHQVHRVPVVPKNHNHLLSSFWPPAVVDPVAGTIQAVYLHQFAKFSSDLGAVTLSAPFHFKSLGIEFCAGLTRQGDNLIASFGVADKESWLAEIEKATVEKTFGKSAL